MLIVVGNIFGKAGYGIVLTTGLFIYTTSFRILLFPKTSDKEEVLSALYIDTFISLDFALLCSLRQTNSVAISKE